MDLKTLVKMTVSKLRDEAMKFDDLVGVHGMEKPELIEILKKKYGITEEHHESQMLLDRKHAVKARIKRLKAEKEQAIAAKDKKQAILLQKRLHQQRRLLKKLVVKVNESNKV